MKQDNRGATLIEILVAMAILAICALPLFKSLILSAQTNVKAREHLSATTAAESVIEEMKADGMEKFLQKNQGNKDITDVEKITEAGVVTGYCFTYPDYEVDGKGYEVKVEVRPYRNTDEGAKDYNSKEKRAERYYNFINRVADELGIMPDKVTLIIKQLRFNK